MKKLYEENEIKKIANAIRNKNNSTDKYKISQMSEAITNIPSGGGLPSGIAAVSVGTYTFETDMMGNSMTTEEFQKTITHGLGVIPDLILFYSPNNVAQTYSMLAALWGNNLVNWRGSSYKTNVFYHTSSTINVAGTTATSTSYGIKNVTNNTFDLKTYGSSVNYYWRAGTYNWIAIKYS